MATKANDDSPTAREVLGLRPKLHLDPETLIVEVGWSTLTIRPKGSRRGGRREIRVSAGWLHEFMIDRAARA